MKHRTDFTEKGDGGQRDQTRHASVLGLAYHPTLLETSLPYRELSLIAKADQRATDPVYSAHKWWARRPPGVMRGLLLATAMPATGSMESYWRDFQSAGHSLAGVSVLDPFLGGGTTAVEAARLGATPHGYDVDPLSVLIVRHELAPADAHELEAAAGELLQFLRSKLGDLYESAGKGREPLHYFHLHEIECPECSAPTALYRSLVIARDLKKHGAVVRNAPIVAFCPDCFAIKALRDADQGGFRCCGRLHRLTESNYSGGRFRCQHCGSKALHGDLQTGKAQRRLLAVEDTSADTYRCIRDPRRADGADERRAAVRLKLDRHCLDIPELPFELERSDVRPISFGATHPADLFTDRQLLVFGHAFRWARTAQVSEATRDALVLSLSNALTTNNKLCGYATDYGRLAPLFSVRSYSLPLLPVELNPLHASGGRGTLVRSFAKTVASASLSVRRYVWSPRRSRALAKTFAFAPTRDASHVACASAENPPPSHRTPVDICVFDPPYFDFISYSELSEFYRAWLTAGNLGGSPLLPSQSQPVSTFGMRFARALRSALTRLALGRPLAFTYHSGNKEAWDAIGLALDNAGLSVTAIWPVRNDGHMGHHTEAGNCEWDAVIVCRRTSECRPGKVTASVAQWKKAVRPLKIRKADVEALSLALQMAGDRYRAAKSLPSAGEE